MNSRPLTGDSTGHGSLVHSVAVGLNNSYGYLGVAHGIAGTAMVKVCNPGCDPAGVAAALDWAISKAAQYPKHIVNMSFRDTTDHTLIREAVARAGNAGILMIAAAGNTPDPVDPLNENPPIGYPAKYWQVYAVSGTLENDAFAETFLAPSVCPGQGSRRGSKVFLSAPFWAWGMSLHGTYDAHCGTSFAAPVVSGVAAIIWASVAINRTDVVAKLTNYFRVDLGPSGHDDRFGYGRVSACNYWGCPTPVSVEITGPTLLPPGVSCTWTASVYGGASPYSIVWSGLLWGGGSQVSGPVWNSGDLWVTVTDVWGSNATTFLGITVDPSAIAPPGCYE